MILTHLFQTPGEIITSDYLLHYNILSFRQFVNKYRNFKDFPKTTSLGRPVKALRTLLVDLANDPAITDSALQTFYREQIAYSPDEIETIQRKHPSAFIEIRSVANFMGSGK